MPETPDAQGRELTDAKSPRAQESVGRPVRRRRPPPSPLSVITATLGLFFVVLTLLAIQVRNGKDPALGPGPAVPALSQPSGKATQATQQATQIVTRTSPVPPP